MFPDAFAIDGNVAIPHYNIFSYSKSQKNRIIAKLRLTLSTHTAVGLIDIPTEEEILAMTEEIRNDPQRFRISA